LLDERLELVAYTDVLCRHYGSGSVGSPRLPPCSTILFSNRAGDSIFLPLTMELGFSSDALAAQPRCPLAEIDSRVEALGSLYVMEGSTLGGRIIARNLERCLGPSRQAAWPISTVMALGRVADVPDRAGPSARRTGCSSGPRRNSDVRAARVVVDTVSPQAATFAIGATRRNDASSTPAVPEQ
jgi:hypothetical protein